MCCLILAEVICQGAAAALCTWDWALRLAQEPNEVLMDTCILNCMTCGDWAKVKFCEASSEPSGTSPNPNLVGGLEHV